MSKNEYSSLVEFLAAKKSVDDRALNKNVWNAMIQNLAQIRHPQIIEIGSGTGTMLTRLLDTVPPNFTTYTAIDREQLLINESRKNLGKWASVNNAVYRDNILTLESGKILVDFVTEDIDTFLKKKGDRKGYDLLIANAFLDLVDIPGILPRLFGILKAGGMFYFSINYDGRTDIEPVIDPELDLKIIELYHKTMDQRIINGVTCCSRHSGLLLSREIVKNKGILLEVGGSDWCVFPSENKYRLEEGYFLHYIINTIKNALCNEPSLSAKVLDEWINKRHKQVDRGELAFIAHQLDFFGKVKD
jgi:SAM-dependent methyltransferase